MHHRRRLAAASREDVVYSPATEYVVYRPLIGADETERVFIAATGTKLKNCEIERGGKIRWVEFFDHDDRYIPPVSNLEDDEGSTTGRTRHEADEAFALSGYSTIIPALMKDLHGGSFVMKIPCQLYSKSEDGSRVYGRLVVASFGPIAIPPPGMTARAVRGVVAYHWESER